MPNCRTTSVTWCIMKACWTHAETHQYMCTVQVWLEGQDDWASYIITHMDAIRAKFFASKAPAAPNGTPATVSVSATMPPMYGTEPVKPTAAAIKQAAAVNPCHCKAKCKAGCRAHRNSAQNVPRWLTCGARSPVKT